MEFQEKNIESGTRREVASAPLGDREFAEGQGPEEGNAVNEVVLWICKGFSGEITRVSVDPALRIEQAIPDIADEIGYFTRDWEKIGMYNLTRDFEYDLGMTFADTKTESGDMVIMADGAACHK